MKRIENSQVIPLEDGLLPSDLATRVFNPKANLEDARPEDCGLPQSKRLNEIIIKSWKQASRVPQVKSQVKSAHKSPHKSAHKSATQLTDPVNRLVIALESGPFSAHKLRNDFGMIHRHIFQKKYLQPALQSGAIELTIPDKPTSRLQKYRLTEAGRALLIAAANGESK